jgi:hypothetical protein
MPWYYWVPGACIGLIVWGYQAGYYSGKRSMIQYITCTPEHRNEYGADGKCAHFRCAHYGKREGQ